MKKNMLLVTAISALIFNSCVRSLYPITENEQELVFKKELLGHWKDKDSAQYIVDTLKDKGGKIYTVTIINPKEGMYSEGFSDTSHFIVSLASIKNRFFLDCTIDMNELADKNIGESTAGAILQTHFIIPLISLRQNLIQVAPIDEEKLASLLTQKKVNLRAELIEKDNLLITERPLTLQQKLRELEKFPVVYGNSTLFRTEN